MKAAQRRTRFQERVRIERDFLAPVNSHFGDDAPLAGMTEAAIHSWEIRSKRALPAEGVAQIAKILREAARRADLLADRSRDVFSGEEEARPDGLDSLRRQLVCLLELNDNQPNESVG
jgi:hypothetical protein